MFVGVRTARPFARHPCSSQPRIPGRLAYGGVGLSHALKSTLMPCQADGHGSYLTRSKSFSQTTGGTGKSAIDGSNNRRALRQLVKKVNRLGRAYQ
jgi:hypothetical protein